jgi:hypothetical protein
MANSQCPRCKNTSFEIIHNSAGGLPYQLCFVQCSSCGTPYGVVETQNIGTVLHEQDKIVDDILSRLKHIETVVSGSAEILTRLKRN